MMQKTSWRIISLVLICMLLSIYLPINARVSFAQDDPVLGKVKTSTMLREGPGANYSLLSEIEAEVQIEALLRDTTANWVYVKVLNSSTTGWLPVSFVEFSENFDVESLPTEEKSPDTAQSVSPADTSATNTFNAEFVQPDIILYEEPNLSAEIVVLPETVEEATILQRTESGIWLEVSIDEKIRGWVILTAFELDEDFVEAWDNLPRPEPEAFAIFEPILLDPLNLIYIDPALTTTFARLNFRIGPGTDHTSIETLPVNTPIEVLAVDDSEFWLLVSVAGQEGWIFRQYVTGYDVSFDTINEGNSLPNLPPSAGNNYYPLGLKAAPGNEVDNDLDGRLNPFLHLATGLIYCFDGEGYTDRGTMTDGGIAVYLFYAEQQGVVFVAPESLIASVGVPATTTLIRAESGFELYRLPNGLFQMNGPQIDGQTFAFQWEGCQPNYRTESL